MYRVYKVLGGLGFRVQKVLRGLGFRRFWGVIMELMEKNMENEMETGIAEKSIGVMWGLYRGYIGIMENQVETTIMGLSRV